MALVLEAETVGDLLDRKTRSGEKRLGLQNHIIAKPRTYWLARSSLNHISQILRCDTQLFRIPRNVFMLAAVLFRKSKEIRRQLLST